MAKIRLAIMFNNVLETKETFFGHKKSIFKVKVVFFLYLFSVKIRLEIMFNVIDKKETFFGNKKFNLLKSQKSYFSNGVNPCFWSKNVVFFLSCFRSK